MLFATIVVLTVIFTYGYFSYKFSYWRRKGVQSFPVTIPFGNIRDILFIRQSYSKAFCEIYEKTSGDFSGIYFGLCPVLFVKNIDLVKNVLIKNFDHFQDRGVHSDEKREPLTAHLFRMEGAEWKNLRVKLSPAFSSGKLKVACEQMVARSETFQQVLMQCEDGVAINLGKFSQKFMLDSLALVGFGFDANCLQDEQAILDYLFTNMKTLHFIKKVVQQAILFWPKLLQFLGLRHQEVRDERFFIDIVDNAVKYRAANEICRNDFLNVLIELKNSGHFGTESGNNEVLNKMSAQAFLYFMAGLETSNLTICYALDYLARYPEIQQKLHSEIDVILQKNSSVITYESILQMEYLDMIVSETLRLRPVLPVLNRICNKPYRIPNSDIEIEVGTKILISVMGLHMDPKYFPNPSEFIPERFSKANKHSIPACCYMPFGEGPRNCIGARQGSLQVKIGLLSVLQNHSVALCSESADSFQHLPGALLLNPSKPIILKMLKRVK